MTSLEVALGFFLVLACAIFTLVYGFMDNHTTIKSLREFLKSFIIHLAGFSACALIIHLLQKGYGQ